MSCQQETGDLFAISQMLPHGSHDWEDISLVRSGLVKRCGDKATTHARKIQESFYPGSTTAEVELRSKAEHAAYLIRGRMFTDRFRSLIHLYNQRKREKLEDNSLRFYFIFSFIAEEFRIISSEQNLFRQNVLNIMTN